MSVPLYIPAVTYHQVLSDDTPLRIRAQGDSMVSGQMFKTEFVRQMDYLANNGFSAITHGELYDWMIGRGSLPAKPIVIDFDDASMLSYKNALPVMRERGQRATMFAVSGLADGDPSICDDMWGVARMRWRELEKLLDAGWMIGAHTRTHLYLGTLPPDPKSDAQIMWELVRGQVDIEQNLGVSARHFAYPAGSWNERAERLVKQVYDSARLFQTRGCAGFIDKETDVYRLPTMNINHDTSFEAFEKIVNHTPEPLEVVLSSQLDGGRRHAVANH